MSGNTYRKTLISLLKENGAKLIRSRKHKVYRLPNGRNYIESTTPSTPSDLNRLAALRKALDLPNTRGQEGERRDKKPLDKKPKTQTKYQPFEGASFAEKLQLQGVRESALETELQSLRDEMEMLIYHSEVSISQLQDQISNQLSTISNLTKSLEAEKQAKCWICRLKIKLSRILAKS